MQTTRIAIRRLLFAALVTAGLAAAPRSASAEAELERAGLRSCPYKQVSARRAEPLHGLTGRAALRPQTEVEPIMIAASGGRVALTGGQTRVTLTHAAAAGEGETLASRLNSLKAGQRIYLVIRGLRAAKQPGALYHLYVGLPQGAKPVKDDYRYAGTLSFYDAVPPEGEAAKDDPSFGGYDITDLLLRLRARKSLGQGVTVTVIPSAPPAGDAEAFIERLELVVQ